MFVTENLQKNALEIMLKFFNSEVIEGENSQ